MRRCPASPARQGKPPEGHNAIIKWLLAPWAGSLYKDRTRRCSSPSGGVLFQIPTPFSLQRGALGPLCWASAGAEGAWSQPGGLGHSQAELPSSGLATGIAQGLHTDRPELHLSCGRSDCHPAPPPGRGNPPEQSQQQPRVTPVTEHGGCRAHTCVCARARAGEGRGARCGVPCQRHQPDGDLPHLFLCTALPPSAAPGVGSAFTSTGKSIVTGRTLQCEPTAQPGSA